MPSTLNWTQVQTRPVLMIPGPTELPWPVIQALNQPPTIQYDRGFDENVLEPTTLALREVFQTRHEVIIMPGSGRTALEAGALSVIEPGDRVLVVGAGVFGVLMREIMGRVGAELGASILVVSDDPGLRARGAWSIALPVGRRSEINRTPIDKNVGHSSVSIEEVAARHCQVRDLSGFDRAQAVGYIHYLCGVEGDCLDGVSLRQSKSRRHSGKLRQVPHFRPGIASGYAVAYASRLKFRRILK